MNEREFDEFARAEMPGLLRYAVLLTADPELAQDLVQDVFVKLHRHWSRVRAAEHPRAYVRTVLTRTFLSWRRRWAVRYVLLADDGEVDGPDASDHAVGVADRDDMWRRLAALPRQQRAVLVLRYYERLTDTEIAAVLGCAEGTVRGYASRGIAALRPQFLLDLTPTEPS